MCLYWNVNNIHTNRCANLDNYIKSKTIHCGHHFGSIFSKWSPKYATLSWCKQFSHWGIKHSYLPCQRALHTTLHEIWKKEGNIMKLMHKNYLNIHKETEKYNRHGWLHHKKNYHFCLRGQGPVFMYKFNAAISDLVQKNHKKSNTQVRSRMSIFWDTYIKTKHKNIIHVTREVSGSS